MVCVHVLKRADGAAGPSSVYFAAAGLANGLFCISLIIPTNTTKGHYGLASVNVGIYEILTAIHFVAVVQKVVVVQRMDIVRQDYTLYGLV